MLLANSHRGDSALGPATRISHVPRDRYTDTPSSSQIRFLDSHPLFRRKQRPLESPLPSLSPRNSSQETLRPNGSLSYDQKPRPKHVPLNIFPYQLRDQLIHQPPSPTSPASSFSNSPEPESDDSVLRVHFSPRPRHFAIEIPPNAYTLGQTPPTPPKSAEATPRASPNLSYSCEPFIANMSHPTTGISRASTMDSSVSALSPEPIPDDRSQPAPGSYLADMNNSSSGSSINQAGQETTNENEYPHNSRATDNLPNSSAGSPQFASHTPTTANTTTNLSGLVCNVHKCTGKEPHGLVGATTTILGDKLYVFGGRVLSKKRPYLTSDIFELDLIRRHWTKIQAKGDIPAPRYFHSVCTLGDTKLICYGGMSPAPSQTLSGNMQQAADPNGEMTVMSDIHVFDAPSKTWLHISTADTPPGRYAHCAAVLPSTAVFTSPSAPLSAILHNPPSSVPNQGSLGVAIDGSGGSEMIVVGGQDSNNKYIDAVSVFNLRSLKWTDTQSLPRSCGAYRSVVAPLTGLSPLKIGAGAESENYGEGANGAIDKVEPTTSMLIYSNYNFLDVRLELQVRMPNGSLVEKSMKGPVSPPGLRFPNGDVFDNHFIVSGTYLTSSKHEYALWALDLRTLEWSRIDAGGGIFSQGSWNRGILWARRNTFVILGNRKRSLVDDYNHRRINFSNICMVELEAFGLYDNPRRLWPTSSYTSISSPILPASVTYKYAHSGGRPLSSAAVDLGAMAMNIRDLADMDLVAISGEKIPVNSYVLSRRWGPYFVKLLRESGATSVGLPNDAASSSDGGTLRPSTLNTASSLASRNSSITITPSITTSHSIAPSSITAISSNSGSTTTGLTPAFDPPTPQNLAPNGRPRQLYLPHTLLTLRALVHYLYTSSLPAPNHLLCTPQILCSLLQLARPYRIDGLLEATVERLHQILDGRNAAAVFNAAAMAAGGGRGTGTPFGKEGEDLINDDLATSAGGLTITKLQSRNNHNNSNNKHPLHSSSSSNDHDGGSGGDGGSGEGGGNSSSEADTGSDISSSTSLSGVSDTSDAAGGGGNAANAGGGKKLSVSDGETWSGGMSCVVGLQKRGLRGLMEGRRIREKQRGKVGGLSSPGMGGLGMGMGMAAMGGETMTAAAAAGQGVNGGHQQHQQQQQQNQHHQQANGAGGAGAVGLGIA